MLWYLYPIQIIISTLPHSAYKGDFFKIKFYLKLFFCCLRAISFFLLFFDGAVLELVFCGMSYRFYWHISFWGCIWHLDHFHYIFFWAQNKIQQFCHFFPLRYTIPHSGQLNKYNPFLTETWVFNTIYDWFSINWENQWELFN